MPHKSIGALDENRKADSVFWFHEVRRHLRHATAAAKTVQAMIDEVETKGAKTPEKPKKETP